MAIRSYVLYPGYQTPFLSRLVAGGAVSIPGSRSDTVGGSVSSGGGSAQSSASDPFNVKVLLRFDGDEFDITENVKEQVGNISTTIHHYKPPYQRL